MPHQPSQKQATAFFLFTLLLSAGIVVWVFFLNKGNLEISVDAAGGVPFAVTIDNKNHQCESSPCTFRLKTGDHTVIVQKDEFLPAIREIKVKWLKTVRENFSLRFIPVIRVWGGEGLPKAILAKREGPVNLFFFEIDPKTNKQNLLGPTELITVFPRPLKNPKILHPPDGTGDRILIQENDQYYLVNYVEKSKISLAREGKIAGAAWITPKYLVIREEDHTATRILLYDVQTGDDFEIETLDFDTVAPSENGKIMLISKKNFKEKGHDLGPSISEAIAIGKNELLEKSEQKEEFFLNEFDPQTLSYQTIIPFQGAWKNDFHELTYQRLPKDKRYYFQSEGKWWEIVMQPE